MNWKCVIWWALLTGKTHHTWESKVSRGTGGPKNVFNGSFIRLRQCRGLTQSLDTPSIPFVLSRLHGKEQDEIE